MANPSALSRWLAVDRNWIAAIAALVVLILLLGVPGSASLPMDMHEIYVAQSVREMAERGDWILPYFNGEPRLNKPPLSYWLTAAFAWLSGDLPRVAAWHARAVSAAGGIGLLLATIAMGALAYGRTKAAVAGLFLATSVGLFSSMHDARPDMLYSACCMAALAALLWSSRRADAGQGTWLPALLMWLAVALAILAKGPHMPALILGGGVIHLWRQGRAWRDIARITRPLAGLALVALLCAPWWFALQSRLGEARIAASQLGGSLLIPSLARLGNPYYLYRPLELLLPWLPLVLLGLAPGYAWRRRDWGWLLWPLGISIIGLSIAPQYRLVYMEPLLGVMALALAHALEPALEDQPGARETRYAWIGLGLQLVVVLGFLGYALYKARLAAPGIALPLGLAAGLGLPAAVLAWGWKRGLGRIAAGAAAALVVTVSWPLGVAARAWWSAERFDTQALAAVAAEKLPADAPLAVFDVNPTIYIYYTGRRVAVLPNEEAIAGALAAAPGGRIGLVTRARHLRGIGERHAVAEIARYSRAGDEDVLALVSARR